jgi:hypothetical protein
MLKVPTITRYVNDKPVAIDANELLDLAYEVMHLRTLFVGAQYGKDDYTVRATLPHLVDAERALALGVEVA